MKKGILKRIVLLTLSVLFVFNSAEVLNVFAYDKNILMQQTISIDSGWRKFPNGYKYINSNGKYSKNTWQKINNYWYYFDKNGYRKIGWINYSGEWYYTNNNGIMVTGWQTISSNRYYFDSSGKRITGWQTIAGKKYYFNNYGVLTIGDGVKIGTSTQTIVDKNCTTEQYLISPAKTEKILVKEAWDEEVDTGKVKTVYTPGECKKVVYRCSCRKDFETTWEWIQHVMNSPKDSHPANGGYNIECALREPQIVIHKEPIYEIIHHEAEYKTITIPAVYGTRQVCE